MDRSHQSARQLVPEQTKQTNGKSPRGILTFRWLPSRACFPSPVTDTLQMHKWISVTGLMCGCQDLQRTGGFSAGEPGPMGVRTGVEKKRSCFLGPQMSTEHDLSDSILIFFSYQEAQI